MNQKYIHIIRLKFFVLSICLCFTLFNKVKAQEILWNDTNVYTIYTINDIVFDMPGEPGLLSFQARRSTLGIGKLYIDAWVNEAWQNIASCSLQTSYSSFGPFNIPHQATRIRFYTEFGATLYKYITDIIVTKAIYIESSEPVLFTDSLFNQLLSISYSGLTQPLTAQISSPYFRLIYPSDGVVSLNSSGTAAVQIQFQPDTMGNYSTSLHLSSDTLNLYVPLTGRWALANNEQTILWDQQLSNLIPGDTIKLTAVSTSGLPIQYSCVCNDVITLLSDTLIAINQGQAQVIASQAGNDSYLPAPSIRAYVEVSNIVPIVDSYSSSQWIIYPNPASTEVSFKGPVVQHIDLFDLSGCLIKQWNGPILQNQILALPKLSSGIYVLMIKGQQTTQYTTLIICN